MGLLRSPGNFKQQYCYYPMKIVGADACSDQLVCCILEEKPTDFRSVWHSQEYMHIPTNTFGLKMMLELKPDVVVLEPTGMRYIKFWLVNLARHGVEVRLVHNTKLPIYRKSLDLPDKDDYADSLALAGYYFEYKDVAHRWVTQRDPDICKMREILHRIESMNRAANAYINRLKQSLSSEFPEHAKAKECARLFWGWLAGVRESKKYDAKLAESEGVGISEFTRFDARHYYDIITHVDKLEKQIKVLQSKSKFCKYMKAFKHWQVGTRIAAALLCQIFPIESLLDEQGKPIVISTWGKKTKRQKKTKKRLSLRKFKKCLGVAPVREWSGKQNRAAKKAGSALARKSLWRWVFTKCDRKDTKLLPHVEELRIMLHRMKADGVPIMKARSRVWVRLVKSLFYEIVYSNDSCSVDKSLSVDLAL